MKIRIDALSGMLPIIEEDRLPDNAAAMVVNARPEAGDIVPIRGLAPSGVSVSNNIGSLSRYHFDKSVLLERADSADFVRGPIANDAFDRVYSAGDSGAPQVHYTSGGSVLSAELGVNPPPAPSIPSSWATATPSNPDTMTYRSVYVTTFVTARGEESEPSDVSRVINRWDGANVSMTLGSASDGRAVFKRLYRSDGGDFQFVAELSAGAQNYTDGTGTADLGYALESENYNAPPDNLQGLANAGNGFMVAWFDNTICFCEPYRPHAWPIDYQYAIPAKVEGVVVTQSAIIVTTDSVPYVFQGSHPAGMSMTPLDLRAPNLSRHGIVDMGESALYPTHDGLVAIGTSGASLVTLDVFSKDQWQALDPASFRAFRYRGDYLCFSSVGAFIFREGGGYWPIDILADASDRVISGEYDDEEGMLYLLVAHADGSRSLSIYDAGDELTMVWKSKRFERRPEAVFGAAKVRSSGSVQMSISGLVRGVESFAFSKTVTDDQAFHLPAKYYDEFYIQLESSARIGAVTMANRVSRLR